MICGNCGFQNQLGDEFCGSCGKFLEWATEPTDTPTTVLLATPAPGPGPVPVTVPDPVPVPDTTVTTGLGAVPQTGYTPAPQLVRCDRCGTANEATRAFCLNCRAPLTRTGIVRGRPWASATGTGTTAGGSGVNTKYVIAGAVMVGLALLGAAVVFGGFLNPGTPNRSPGASPVAVSSSLPIATPLASSIAGSAAPTTPLETTEPSASPDGSTPAPTEGTPPPVTGLRCQDQPIQAAAPGRWLVTEVRWGRRNSNDYLALLLAPSSESAEIAAVDAALLPLTEVSSRFGVDPPQSGDIALLLAFNEQVGSDGSFGGQPGLRALKEVQVVRAGPRRVRVVMGVAGEGCYEISPASWSGSGPIELFVDLRR
ncbi:MAG: double zinc ribbon domain-containing protein [Candidatus Limnocylindrales bacterium]